MHPPRRGARNRLLAARGPADHGLLDPWILAQAEMQGPLVLRRVSGTPGNLLQLLLTVPEDPHLRTDGAAIGRLPAQIEADPAAISRDRVLVDEQRTPLVGNDDIQCAAIP